MCYTEKIQFKDLNDLSISSCPSIYQEMLEKDVELRVTIIGDRIFPVAIYSQDVANPSDISAVDWRRSPDLLGKISPTKSSFL